MLPQTFINEGSSQYHSKCCRGWCPPPHSSLALTVWSRSIGFILSILSNAGYILRYTGLGAPCYPERPFTARHHNAENQWGEVVVAEPANNSVCPAHHQTMRTHSYSIYPIEITRLTVSWEREPPACLSPAIARHACFRRCIATPTCPGDSHLQRVMVGSSRSALRSSRLCLQFKQTTASKVL